VVECGGLENRCSQRWGPWVRIPPSPFFIHIPYKESMIITPYITIGLLIISNIFMTFAWYGHLNYKSYPLYTVIFVSWLIAFFEYCFQVPANRIGHGYFSAAELKTIQEVITFAVFIIFSYLYLKEPIHWNHVVGFCLIGLAVFVIFKKW
jgi:uncharacterized protein (DUF486 family)